MKSPETIKLLLLKIKALADNGVGGEKDNAYWTLKALLTKYGLTVDDLYCTEKERWIFSYKTAWEKQILFQIVLMVLQNEGSTSYYRSKKHKTSVAFELSVAEHTEVSALYEHYCRQWRSDMDSVFQAFIQKHRLYGPPSNSEGGSMTLEEYEKLLFIMNGLNSHTYQKPMKLLAGKQL